jgi:hypothetical protein
MRGNSKAQGFWRPVGPHYCKRATQNLAFIGQDMLTLLSPLSILGGDDTILHLQTSLKIAFQWCFNGASIASFLCFLSSHFHSYSTFLV